MPHIPLRELKPELFLDEYQTDSEDDGFEDSDEEKDEDGNIINFELFHLVKLDRGLQ